MRHERTDKRSPISEQHEISIIDLDRLDPYDFERVVATLFERLGYSTKNTPKSGDKGYDVKATLGDQIIVIECKHQKGPVSRPVIQKLFGAASAHQDATRGILVTTSHFSRQAEDYAAQFNDNDTLQIDLWDITHLTKKGRSVNMIFRDTNDPTTLVVWCGRTDFEQMEPRCIAYLAKRISSRPRDPRSSLSVQYDNVGVQGAYLARYHVDVQFKTSTYLLDRKKESGRQLIVKNDSLSKDEKKYWEQSHFTELCDDTDVITKTYATVHATPFSEDRKLRDSICKRLSTWKSYKGMNGVVYKKYCEVEPKDIDMEISTVALVRGTISVRIGPKEYTFKVADNPSREVGLFTSRYPAADGSASSLNDDAFVLCNDCGELEVPGAQIACTVCGRTLCKAHRRKWPWVLKDHPGGALCANCYLSADPRRYGLPSPVNSRNAASIVAVLGLIPGLPYLLARRWLLAFVFTGSVILIASGYWNSGVESYISQAFARILPEISPSASLAMALAIVFGLTIIATGSWAHLLKKHENTMEVLRHYAPPWSDEKS